MSFLEDWPYLDDRTPNQIKRDREEMAKYLFVQKKNDRWFPLPIKIKPKSRWRKLREILALLIFPELEEERDSWY